MQREVREDRDDAGDTGGGKSPFEPVGPIGGGDVIGNIEVRSGNGIKWLLVREGEGLVLAAHRALDLYIRAECHIRVRVLVAEPLNHWRCYVEFRPAPSSGVAP
jgi:hypothetical protein